MTKILQIARWEFMEKVKTRAFIISLLLMPVIIGAFATLPTMLAMKEDTDTKKFILYDETLSYASPLQKRLGEHYKLQNGKPNFEMMPVDIHSMTPDSAVRYYTPQILDEKYTGIFILHKDVEKTRSLEYRSGNVGNGRDIERISDAVKDIMTERMLASNGIDLKVYEQANKPIDTRTIKISASGEKESNFLETFGTAYGSAIIMFFLITFTGQMLVRSLLEEKSNRIIEVLLSSCSPLELMLGKLMGLCGLGLLQTGVWALIGIAIATKFGTLGFLSTIPLILVYMILGYFFYASILIGVGSLATTEQEAQQMTGYMTMVVMLPVVFLAPLLQNPGSPMVKVLSYIPFMTPTIMAMRMAIMMPPWWEIALTILLMITSVLCVMFISSRVFRAAILSYGKRPTLPEIIGFIRDKG